MKVKVIAKNHKMVNELKDYIHDALQNIDEDQSLCRTVCQSLCRTVCQSIQEMLEECCNVEEHIEHLRD